MPQAHDGGIRLLLVEDDPLFATSLRALLGNAGFEVHTIASGDDPDFANQLREADVAILDLELPGRSGFELLHDVAGSDDLTATPILMLTAHDPMAYRLRALSMGADDFMIKPPNPEELVLRLKALLKRSAKGRSADKRVVVHSGSGSDLLLLTHSIVLIQAAKNYCFVHTQTERHMTNESISHLSERLDDQFVQTHRSYLVNRAFVRGARWLSNSEYVLDVDAQTLAQIPVSRAYRKAIREALGL